MDKKNHIVSLNDYKGSHLEKSYGVVSAEEPKLSLMDQVNQIAKSCNDGFESGKTSEEALEKAFEQLEGHLESHLEKSEANVTFERVGDLGDYSYSLIEKAEKKTPSKEETEKMEKMEKADKKAYMEKMGYGEVEKAEEEEEEEEEEAED